MANLTWEIENEVVRVWLFRGGLTSSSLAGDSLDPIYTTLPSWSSSYIHHNTWRSHMVVVSGLVRGSLQRHIDEGKDGGVLKILVLLYLYVGCRKPSLMSFPRHLLTLLSWQAYLQVSFTSFLKLCAVHPKTEALHGFIYFCAAPWGITLLSLQ